MRKDMDFMTVTGPRPLSEMGPTLPHEHVFLNLMPEYKAQGVLNDERLAVEELGKLPSVGCRTIFDLTSLEIDRDPEALKRISEETAVAIVMGSGHYRDPYLSPEHLDRNEVEALTEALVDEIETGYRNTGIRPGIIGEVGSNHKWISSREERALRTAGRAAKRTGLTVFTHAARWPLGLPQLDILQREGVDPRHVVIGHCDMVPSMEYHQAVADRGAFVEFDTIRGRDEFVTMRQVEYVMNMVRRGHIEQVLISHDLCLTTLYQAYGGNRYTFIFDSFLDLLGDAGLNADELRVITIDNPARAVSATINR